MQNPKYYTIAEVSELFGIGQANLRYLENVIPRFKIRKIREEILFRIKY
ncbi:MAG UNVERIFIED_CONTAM: hypothetical protein LVQ98_05085 [Rickettsiaceae bacterium]|jgi:hypothetical protein